MATHNRLEKSIFQEWMLALTVKCWFASGVGDPNWDDYCPFFQTYGKTGYFELIHIYSPHSALRTSQRKTSVLWSPVHHVVLLSHSREVLEASTVTLAPARNWKAKLFPSLSSDFVENSTARERKRERQCDETDRTIAMQDANKGKQDTVTPFTKHTLQAGMSFNNPSLQKKAHSQYKHSVCSGSVDVENRNWKETPQE